MINETTNRLQIGQNSVINAASNSQGKDKLQKQDFMNLFMYELSNQNPLDPMDSSKMMSSLAQLGSMEQMQSMNAELKNIASTQQQMIQLNSLNYLNRNVLVNNDSFQYNGDQQVSLNFNLAASANKVSAQIFNQSGQIVRQIELGQKISGDHNLIWDGRNDQGQQAERGEYQAKVFAYDQQGKKIDAMVSRPEKITQIKLEGGQPMLKVKEKFIPISEAMLIDSSLPQKL